MINYKVLYCSTISMQKYKVVKMRGYATIGAGLCNYRPGDMTCPQSTLLNVYTSQE